MKQLILLSCLFFFNLFYISNTACMDQTVHCQPIIPPSEFPLLPLSSILYYLQEGFCGATLVQVPCGYKQIKTLVEGDVVIDCNGKEKEITAISRHYVKRYIKLIVGDMSIYTGYDQVYYAFPTGSLVTARDINAGDMLLNNAHEPCLVTYAQLVQENELLYYLTVEDHTFAIERGCLCVHNAQPLMLGASSICLSNVMIINPIVATIGATIALAHKAYQEYIQQYSVGDEKYTLSVDVVLAERSYYTQRWIALHAIQQELVCIKNDLEKVKALCGTNSSSFTYQFLKQTNVQNSYNQSSLLKFSPESEINLSDKQREDLRALRETDLQILEQEIIELQYILALHIDELIEQVNAAQSEYKDALGPISYAADLWNNKNNNATDLIGLQTYKAVLLEDHLLDNFKQKFNELKIVALYYNNCANVMCIKQSTNIISVSEKLMPIIVGYEQWVIKEQARVAKNIIVLEEHFAHRGITVGHIKSETKNAFAKSRKARNDLAIAEAKNKLVSVAVSGGPNKNNNDDDKERKKNTLTKSEFFKKVKDHYEHYRDGVYRRKRNAKGIENAEYLQWDHLHGDVEAYNKAEHHIGSIDPQTLRLYKGPVFVREFPLT